MRTIATILGMLLLAAIFSLCLKLRPSQIETDLLAKSQQVLTTSGANWAHVDIDGRDVTLSGIAPSIEIRDQVIEQVAGISGVRIVHFAGDNDTPVASSDTESSTATPTESDKKVEKPVSEPKTITVEAVTLPSIMARFDGQKLEISGAVSSVTIKKTLSDHISAIPGITEVKNSLTINPQITENSANEILAAINALTQLDAGELDIHRNQIALTGSSSSPAAPGKIIEATLSGAIEKGYQVTTDIALTETDGSVLGCQQQFDKLLADRKILFGKGSSKILSSSNQLLARLTQVAVGCTTLQITIAGYTDNTGSDKINSQLSMDRADAVKQHLVDHGIKPSRLTAEGRGSSNPIADNHTTDGRAQNRRIEFIIGGG